MKLTKVQREAVLKAHEVGARVRCKAVTGRALAALGLVKAHQKTWTETYYTRGGKKRQRNGLTVWYELTEEGKQKRDEMIRDLPGMLDAIHYVEVLSYDAEALSRQVGAAELGTRGRNIEHAIRLGLIRHKTVKSLELTEEARELFFGEQDNIAEHIDPDEFMGTHAGYQEP